MQATSAALSTPLGAVPIVATLRNVLLTHFQVDLIEVHEEHHDCHGFQGQKWGPWLYHIFTINTTWKPRKQKQLRTLSANTTNWRRIECFFHNHMQKISIRFQNILLGRSKSSVSSYHNHRWSAQNDLLDYFFNQRPEAAHLDLVASTWGRSCGLEAHWTKDDESIERPLSAWAKAKWDHYL